jgi:thiol-disulfide isomerase/thioredoxin
MQFSHALIGIAAAALALSGSGPAAGRGPVPAPHLAETSFAALTQPLPYPYNEAGNADSDVDAARSRAKAAHKLLLIDMGGNWCGDCRVLAGTMALPDLAPFITRHFEVVTVDVGRFSKNMAVAQRFGAKRPAGVPALLIVDPVSGALLDKGHTEALADARAMSPQALADWLTHWLR